MQSTVHSVVLIQQILLTHVTVSLDTANYSRGARVVVLTWGGGDGDLYGDLS